MDLEKNYKFMNNFKVIKKNKLKDINQMIFNRKLTIFSLLLVIFIESIGMSLIIPLLNPLIYDYNISIIDKDTSIEIRNFLYSVTFSSFAFFMFLSSPILGDLSDKYGRKPILLICLGGAFLSYGISALAVATGSITLFIIGRIISGLTAGSLPVAQAAIIDISSPSQKVSNIGLLLFAVSIGYIIGPLMSGFLSDNLLNKHFSLSLPLYIVSFLSFVDIILIIILMKETHQYIPKKIDWLASFKNISVLFQDKNVHFIIFIFLFMQLGWSGYFQFIGLYLNEKVGFNPQKISIFFAFIGAGMSLAFCYLINIFQKYFKNRQTFIIGIGCIFLALLGELMVLTHALLYILAFLGAIGFGLSYPAIIALLSEGATKRSQGLIMGTGTTISAFAAFMSAFISGIVAEFGTEWPIYMAIAYIATSLIIFFTFNRVAIPTLGSEDHKYLEIQDKNFEVTQMK